MSNPQGCLVLISLLLSLSIASTARAQFFTGPAASGVGSGGRAAVDPGESAFLNPASLAFLQRYNVSAYMGVGKHSGSGEENLTAVSLADGTPESIVSGAITYARKRLDFENHDSDTQSDLQVGLAGFALKKFAIGVAGHRLTDQILTFGVGQEYSQYNAHLGMIYVPVESFGVGFVAYDILAAPTSVPAAYRPVPTHAIAFNYVQEKAFRVRMDLVRPDTMNPGRRINVSAGLESMLKEMVIFRVGSYWQETADRHYFTTGIGFHGPRLSFDYALQKDVRDGDNFRHVVDLWLTL